jgi:prepilin-type N-terminal cleavage/methylation domain-containing protein
MTDTSAHAVRRGFTLAELLVVIAVIILLLTLLAPSVNRILEFGRLITCGTRLEQLNVAETAYVADSGGLMCRARDYLTTEYPQASSLSGIPGWPNIGSIPDQSILIVEGYMSNTPEAFTCPADARVRVPPASRAIKPATFSYTRNGHIQRVGDWGYPAPRLMPRPESTFMLFEESEYSPFNDGYVIPNCWDLITERHFGQGRMLFFDGHIEVISGATFNQQTPLWRQVNYFEP